MSHGRMARFQTQTEEESSRHGMTRPPERLGALREEKRWEPPQCPNPDGGRTDAGGGEGTKTHPPPEKPGSNRPMVATARRDEAQRRRRTRGWRRQMEPAAQVTCPNTPPAHLSPQPKVTRIRVVSTAKRHQRRRWEAEPVRGLRQRRAAMGPQDTAGVTSGSRGEANNLGERAQRGQRLTERQRRGATPNGRARLTQAADEGGKGEGEPLPRSARTWRAARERGGTPARPRGGTPREGGH